ncbi:hypothetical protein WDU94_004473 [Cyamophila willieti]
MTSPSRSFQSRLGQKFTSDSDLIINSSTTAPLSSPYHSDVAPTETREYHVLDQILSDLTPAPITTSASTSTSIKTETNAASPGLEQVVSHSRRASSHYSHYSNINHQTKQVQAHVHFTPSQEQAHIPISPYAKLHAHTHLNVSEKFTLPN